MENTYVLDGTNKDGAAVDHQVFSDMTEDEAKAAAAICMADKTDHQWTLSDDSTRKVILCNQP